MKSHMPPYPYSQLPPAGQICLLIQKGTVSIHDYYSYTVMWVYMLFNDLSLTSPEENAALALPVAPLQHCSMGQSFSPLEPRPTGPSKKSPGERRCEPGREQGRGRQAAPKYPTDREPGEGIDAEHIRAMGSESPQRSGQPEDERMTVSNSSGTGKIPAANQPDTSLSLQSEAAVEARVLPREQEADVVALRKENAVLSSELQDLREELERRLEDLEAQRRAEAEARTRLKQLSKKRAGREAEVEEQERGEKGGAGAGAHRDGEAEEGPGLPGSTGEQGGKRGGTAGRAGAGGQGAGIDGAEHPDESTAV